MKIISKFKDYYDHIGHEFGEDPKIIFNRSPIIHNDAVLKELNKVMRDFYYRLPNATIHGADLYEFRWLSINGFLWLLYRLNGSSSSFKIIEDSVFDHITKANNEQRRHRWYGRDPLDTERCMNSKELIQPLIGIHKKLGTPIFAFDGNGFGEKMQESNGVITYKAPNLTEYGFASYYPAYQIFQDLCHFIGNELRDAPDTKPPVVIEDKYKIEGHGFDKKISFRHRKPD